MAVAVDREAARDLAPRFDEALGLVHNEFRGLDRGEQYRNAFARLLKADPLGRVLMRGTDQRDLSVPVAAPGDRGDAPRQRPTARPGRWRRADVLARGRRGAAGTRVSIEEPNPAYVAAYRELLAGMPWLEEEMVLSAGRSWRAMAPFGAVPSSTETPI